MHIVAVPVLGIIFNILLQCIEANLTLDFKVTKISANHKPANCNVANTTYAHGETFKLDCKTQCVCENGRHACSSLCPKEQLPAPEDTISCRSPRLVEVPGHCCKMWLCENPTADVYATCHNSSTSPWTPCSRMCGLGISTRFTTTTAGCNQLSNLRLCENRKCETQQQDNTAKRRQDERNTERQDAENGRKKNQQYLIKTKQLKHKLKRQHQQQKHNQHHLDNKQEQQLLQKHLEHEHRIRKGHECRSLQRLGPARIRLGECVSKKLYRPKICGRCHQNTKCCVPSVSTTIQVELLCPMNAMDPISFVQQELNTEHQQGQLFYQKSSDSSSSLTSLWDTHSLDAIDQEYLQSHQIQITNKFIAVEWILKCECTKTLYDLNGTEYTAVDTVRICKETLNKFMKKNSDFIGCKVIYAPSRAVDDSKLEEYRKTFSEIEKYPDFVAGFDLSGQEDMSPPLKDFTRELLNMPDRTDFLLHAGETNWFGTSIDENLIDAVQLKTRRIGNPYALFKHPLVMNYVKNNDIAVEVLPISNQVLGFMSDFRNHPCSHLFADNYPVVVSSDYPSFWNVKPLSHDFYMAFLGIASFHSDLKLLKKLAENSINYSSLSKTQKAQAIKKWESKWEKYIASL